MAQSRWEHKDNGHGINLRQLGLVDEPAKDHLLHTERLRKIAQFLLHRAGVDHKQGGG